jgi:hypothetical protein
MLRTEGVKLSTRLRGYASEHWRQKETPPERYPVANLPVDFVRVV